MHFRPNYFRMLLKYSSDGKIELIEIEIVIQTKGRYGFWGKHFGIRDHPFFKCENISLFIIPHKEYKGMASKDDEEPRMNLDEVYKLTLKRVKKI